MTEGVWRDYYTGAELDDFPKPWKKPHDELRGEGSDCLGLYTWWPEKGHVIQFDTSWWEGDCTGAWRGCPCKILIFWFWNKFLVRLSVQGFDFLVLEYFFGQGVRARTSSFPL